MLRGIEVVRGQTVPGGCVCDTLTLDHRDRHRRRLTMTTDGGLSFLLDLERATPLRDGDALRLEDGRLVRVRAAPEQVVEIQAESPLMLKRIIWHLGNRHVPTEIGDEAVYVAEDHVLIEMVRGLGGTATPLERSFHPEQGAYDHASGGHPQHHRHRAESDAGDD